MYSLNIQRHKTAKEISVVSKKEKKKDAEFAFRYIPTDALDIISKTDQ